MKKMITPERKQAILDAYRVGTSIKEICTLFEVSNCTIFRFTTEAGIIRPKYTISDEIKAQIIEAYLTGASIQKVARDFGTRPNTVSGILRATDAKRPLNTINPASRKAIVDAYTNGYPTSDVADRYQVNPSTVLKFVKEAGDKIRSQKGAINATGQQIVALYTAGYTLEEVARQTGFSLTAVYKLLLREGATIRTISETVPTINYSTGEGMKVRDALRKTPQYFAWRNAVAVRDSKTCQHCGAKGKKAQLEADHIHPFSAILIEHNIQSFEQGLACSALWDISNGRILCKRCHKATPTYGLKAKKLHRKTNP